VEKIGVTKKVSLTLTQDGWNFLNGIMKKHNYNQSQALRFVIEQAPDKIPKFTRALKLSRTRFEFKPL
jgi:hypothetical protein